MYLNIILSIKFDAKILLFFYSFNFFGIIIAVTLCLQAIKYNEQKGKTMDIASLLGLIGALGFIIYAMVSGGGVGPFIDVPS